jgi:hypothetical protein
MAVAVASNKERSLRRRRLAFALGLTGLFVLIALLGALVYSQIRCGPGSEGFVTWQQLIDDFDGEYAGGEFRNGTFRSFDPYDASGAGLPTRILVVDRVAEVSVSINHRTLTRIALQSTGASQTGPRFGGVLTSIAGRDIRDGDMVKMSLSLYWGIWNPSDFAQWPAEIVYEFNREADGYAPTVIGFADVRTCYVPMALGGEPQPRAPLPKYNPRLVGHDFGSDGITMYRWNFTESRGRIELGSFAPGGPELAIRAVVGVVNEAPRGWSVFGATVATPCTPGPTCLGAGAFRVWVHNSTNVPADLDGGAEVWDGTASRPARGIFVGPGNVNESDAGRALTPLDPRSGVRVIRGNHSAAGSDMIWVEIRVQVPLGTLEGRYRLDLSISLRSENSSRSAEFIRVTVPLLLN